MFCTSKYLINTLHRKRSSKSFSQVSICGTYCNAHRVDSEFCGCDLAKLSCECPSVGLVEMLPASTLKCTDAMVRGFLAVPRCDSCRDAFCVDSDLFVQI